MSHRENEPDPNHGPMTESLGGANGTAGRAEALYRRTLDLDAEALLDFPTLRLLQEWRSGLLPPVVVEAVLWIARARHERHGRRSVVTSIWRTPAENVRLRSRSTMHPELRAVDVGSVGDDLDERIRLEVCDGFPSVVQSRVPELDHGTGPHYHVGATYEEQRAWLAELASRPAG